MAFKVFEALPFGDALYRTSQRLVTGRYLPKVNETSLKTYMIPVEALNAISGAQVSLEFGAGRGLLTPLLLGAAGAKTAYAYDLQRLANLDQVNHVLARLGALRNETWKPVTSFEELRENYNVDYRAPGDARATGLDDNSVDLIYSTATLEHIPPASIREILGECKRILKPEGRMCFTIDYHDHYASADPSIGYMNFYQFGEREWRKFNPPTHYQNRLRHSDYVSIFQGEGLQILEQTPLFETWSESDLTRVKVHEQFQHYSHEDLTASNGYFLLSSNV